MSIVVAGLVIFAFSLLYAIGFIVNLFWVVLGLVLATTFLYTVCPRYCTICKRNHWLLGIIISSKPHVYWLPPKGFSFFEIRHGDGTICCQLKDEMWLLLRVGKLSISWREDRE